jgi:hypothetical protein
MTLKRLVLVMALIVISHSASAVPTTLNDFFLPGSQPNQSGSFRPPTQCDNCHAGFGLNIEQNFNWRGSMMAMAARDPLYFATVDIANQDAPNSGDLCIRCHSPVGWLSGRSTPTDGSALTRTDLDGVQCHYCHKSVKPSPLGVNPYPSDANYTATTYGPDQTYLGTLTNIPPTEANGMYVVSNLDQRRGAIVDAASPHDFLYSPMHLTSNICGTCHDVSNPVFTKNASGQYQPNAFDAPAPNFDLRTMFPVERTYSEWTVSDYNTAQGVYAPEFGTDNGVVSTCQDCHMPKYDGLACAQGGTRQNLGVHDFTGGNTKVGKWVRYLFPSDVTQQQVDSGIVRARRTLQKAATMDLEATVEGGSVHAEVTITNETGHKLPSGYPEGRRIWINVKAFDAQQQMIFESGAYNASTGVLTHDEQIKIYEIHPGISPGLADVLGMPSGTSFHFVLNDTVYMDNRIPPRGATNAELAMIQSPVVDYTYADGQYWDISDYDLPLATDSIVATLYYQTTSKEYIEFLRDNNVTSSRGDDLYAMWDTTGKSSPELMEQEYFRVIHPLAAVDDLTIVFDSEGSGEVHFMLNWTPVNGATSYEIYNMASPDDLVGTLVGTVAAPPFALTESATWDNVRYFRVRAVE